MEPVWAPSVISHFQVLVQQVEPAAQFVSEDVAPLDEDNAAVGERIDRGVVPVDDNDGDAGSAGLAKIPTPPRTTRRSKSLIMSSSGKSGGFNRERFAQGWRESERLP